MQWALHNTGQTLCSQTGTADADVDAPEGWALETGSEAITVAVLDTGIQQDHPDLRAKVVGSVNFTSSPSSTDLKGHGTFVAGIIAASTNNYFLTGSSSSPTKNWLGISGANWNARILNVKVCSDEGKCEDFAIAKGIVYAVNSGAKVINMSFGGFAFSRNWIYPIRYSDEHGVTLVAAAGNYNVNQPFYPCAEWPVLCVAATDNRDQKSSFSNFGAFWVQVAAPGTCIRSTSPQDSYGFGDGTSFAAPFVSGLAALVLARFPEYLVSYPWSGPAYADDNVRSKILSSCDPISGTGTLWWKGRINYAKALKLGSGDRHRQTGGPQEVAQWEEVPKMNVKRLPLTKGGAVLLLVALTSSCKFLGFESGDNNLFMPPFAEFPSNSGLAFDIVFSKPAYSVSDSIEIAFRLTNTSSSTINLRFTPQAEFYVYVLNGSSAVVQYGYWWNIGEGFPSVPAQEVSASIPPGGAFERTGTVRRPLSPGHYRIRGDSYVAPGNGGKYQDLNIQP